MDFEQILKEVLWRLVTEGSISSRRIKRVFGLDDDALEDLRRELIGIKRLAADVDGELLVWAPAARPEPIHLAPAPLPALRHVPPVPSPDRDLPGAERRHLTVMFCDLADSTRLSAQLDPEDMGDVIRAYQEAVSEAVRRFDGYIARFMGDGVLVYFGYPNAQEKDAERAVRTGLAILDGLPALSAELARGNGTRLAVRIGIATGIVVVGETIGQGAAREQTVVGETPNLAARLQALAGPDAILISAATYDLVGDIFACEGLGAHALKGIAEPVQVWRVTGLREEDDGELETTAADFPLVGRDEEIGLLRRAWQQTKEEGHGQVVFVSGEPGIGKSALVDTLRRAARAEGLTRITFRGSPYHTNSALYPVVEHWKRLAGWQPEDDSAGRLGKLESVLAGYRLPREEAVPLFASLLSVPLADGDPKLDLTPQQLKEHTEDALVALSLEEAERQPLLEVWEDVHWADPSTLDVLGQLIDQAPTVPLLIVLTFRPEFAPPWPARSHVRPLTLNRLERPQIEAMAVSLAGGKALPADVVEHIVQKTDGVPLFVEEMTKAVLGSSVLRADGDRYTLTGPLSEVSIPASLHESLMARLDRLPTVREVAQLGAVLGRDFAYEMLRAITSLDEPRLRDVLGRLVEAELLYQRGRPPRSRYIFKHALIQDAAYQSLLRRTRQHYHRQVAELLDSNFADMVEASPELVAHHYSEAGLPAPAVAYWQRAGEKAARRSANQEAIGHLTAGLAQLAQLPETPERAKQELALQRLLGQASFATRGYASHEARRAFSRARELCAVIGDDDGIHPVLLGVWLFEYGAAKHANAATTANEALTRAERTENAGAHILGHLLVGISSMHLGNLTLARPQFEAGIGWYRGLTEAEAMRVASEYGLELGVPMYGFAAWCLWLLGYPEHALRLGDEALATAERIQHDYTRSRGLYYNSTLHALRREWPIVKSRAAAAIASAQERSHAMVAAVGRIMQGSAQAMLAPGEEFVAEIREALAAYRATGAGTQSTYHLILLAQALAECGRTGEGLSALREAAALAEESGERYVEAEIHRLQGNLLLAGNASGEAEACYVRALEVSRAQQARSLELRAACDVARLWAERGERARAADLLAPVYGWFTEGFDTADLKEAKTLLDKLTEPAIAAEG
ncbi:MAG TPA: adenylate/guanylate cyclase domain-containing protein [Stellaceae bacterium]|nr:adenylate/guanylate cyclase domain-containing protein [Stellaceae bacterium]